jgi:DNA polymerase-3 subunit gamma/tau
MSYQVLARKWRPKNFESLIGQDHVVRALTHALESKRLHHAYLFTGTRGVGKTTLSRILAKSLNCVGPDGHGDITARPCGVCRACVAIDGGHFVDYIEMDAASNRGVDEMAALLEQAVYSPADARFKVYMIDEVHMLTSHAFNAMLKTLEEPPEYVKFILATTDAQKIPVTVLSRCLQFNLKQMTPAQIAGHLETILNAEGVRFEAPALVLIGRAAEGSMRDALSLTDQAIAYNAGELSEAALRSMLGTLDSSYLARLLDALLADDGAALLAVADEMQERSLSFRVALQDLASLLHRIAIIQTVPNVHNPDWTDRAAVEGFAAAFSPEEIQLNYEICNRGRDDLDLAPDEYAGFTMTLLRMLAFRPGSVTEQATGPSAQAVPRAAPVRNAPTAAGSAVPRRPAAVIAAPVSAQPAPPLIEAAGLAQGVPDKAPALATEPLPFDGNWLGLALQLKVSGLTRQLVEQAQLVTVEGNHFRLRVPIKNLLETGTIDKLKASLSQHFGRPIRVSAELGSVTGITVAATEESERAVRQAQAVDAIETDPFVRALVKDFGATIVPGSIKPAS